LEIKTIAIVLRREKFREYDEKILLFTRELGIITSTSFGSRSPSSVRRKTLAGANWLKIVLSVRHSWYVLSEADLYKKIHGNSRSDFWFVFPPLILQYQNLLLRAVPVKNLFKIVYILSRRSVSECDLDRVKTFFLLSLLFECGVFPVFTGCAVCGSECSEYYITAADGTFTGEACVLHIQKNAGMCKVSKPLLFLLKTFYSGYTPHILFFNKFFMRSSSSLWDVPVFDDNVFREAVKFSESFLSLQI